MVSKGILHQVTTGLIASLSAFYIGMANGWISPNIDRWLSPETDIRMSVDESTWVVSIIAIGNVLCTIPTGFLVDILGRKAILLATSPVIIATWIVVICTRSVEWLYAVRFVQGCAMGSVFTVLPLYLAEISDIKIRGLLGAMFVGSFNAGILAEYVLGYYLSYDYLSYANLITPILFLVVFSTKPETPYFLVAKHNRTEASKSLAWLRGKEILTVDEELNGIVSSLESTTQLKSGFKDLLATYAVRRALAVLLTVVSVQIFSGTSAILSLASLIFKSAGKSFLTPGEFSISVAIVQVAGTFVAAPIVDRLGRRFLLVWAILICGVAQSLVAGYFYLKTFIDVSAYSWSPAAFLAVYFFFSSVGAGSLIGIIQGELFPMNLRGAASSCAVVTGMSLSFVSLKMYQMIAETVGIYVNHVIFAGVCAVGFVVVFIFMPETKGLTFDEIQALLAKRN